MQSYVLRRDDGNSTSPLHHLRRPRGWYDLGKRDHTPDVPEGLQNETYEGDETWIMEYGPEYVDPPGCAREEASGVQTEEDTDDFEYGDSDTD